VGASGTDQSSIVYIDKGANDGLKTDMPVMTADGIVGRLKDVFPTTSQLMLISDATSGVGVIVESTRTRGVLKGGSFGQVQVINVSPDDRIKPGDKIITSGGDQIFPRGMPVGTVESVSPDPDRDPLVDIAVRPAANLSQLEEVLVITSTGDAISTQEARDMAESEAEGQAAQKRASDILSERLPSRIDPRAPADTNPDENVDSTGNLVKPLTPPKPLHPDGFSPGATPPATELTPGARIVPVKNGTEELPPPKATAPKPADKAAEATPTATTDAAATPHKGVQLDAEGNPVPARPKTESAATAATRTGKATAPATGAMPGSPSGNTVSTVPHRQTPAPAGATTSTASPATRALVPGSSAARPATTTAPLKPSTTTRVIVDGPEDRTQTATPAARTPASTAAKPAGSATPRSATPANRSPILVPDDGSRPPRTTTPRQPAQTSQPQTPAPQGMGA
jgi:rod shape-determining protein MreC